MGVENILLAISVLVSVILAYRSIRGETKKESKEAKQIAEKAIDSKIDTRLKTFEVAIETNHLEHFRADLNNTLSKIKSDVDSTKVDIGIIRASLEELDDVKVDLGCVKADMESIKNSNTIIRDNYKSMDQRIDATFKSVDNLRSNDQIHSEKLARYDERIGTIITQVNRLVEKVWNGSAKHNIIKLEEN